MRLREELALEPIGVEPAEDLLERHDDADAAASPLAPVRAADDVAAACVVFRFFVWIEELDGADARPPREPLAHLAEKRQRIALEIRRDKRVVGGEEILRRG